MKENVWKKSFVAGPYKIKELSLGNQLELSILSDELGKFWKFEGDKVSIDVDGIKAAMKSGELKDTIVRIEQLLPEILLTEELKIYLLYFSFTTGKNIKHKT